MVELVVGTAVLLATVFVAEGVWERHRLSRHRTRIADCRDGQLALLVGKIIPLTELEAPITGRNCVAYSVVGKFRRWRRRDKIATTVFALDDGSGRAHVVADDVSLELEMGRNLLDSLHARTDRRQLEALGLGVVDRVYEGALEPGTIIAAFGEVQMLPVAGTTDQSGYRDGHVMQVKLVRPRRGLFLVSDSPSLQRTG